ncbi:MAG: phosphoglucosamine mutase [Clostridia bacterium]|nr:phosphoglucosamine mutase [Clostridia bacterium]
MGRYFGTDGFRGEANKVLTVDHAYKIGRFLGWYYSEKRKSGNKNGRAKIVIGKDTRRSSYMFEYILAGGVVSSGADAYLLHVTTTPCTAWVTRTDEFDCGIMISASHNPFYDNGIKLLNSKGEKMEDEVIELVEACLDGEVTASGGKITEIPFAGKDEIGKSVDYVSGRNRYLGYLISLGMYSFRDVKVGLDCANGSSWNLARNVFEALGASTFIIGNEPDGTNINENIGSTHIERLCSLVKERSLDVGFAFDGDADRCIAVDEKGNVVDGDAILYICGKYMKERGELKNNTVVTTVMSNLGLYKAFDELGIAYAQTQVGDKYVHDYMMKEGCVLGGEQSGHIIFSRYATTGDGILTELKVMEVMLSKKMKLSELTSGFTVYPQTLVNVRVSDKKMAVSDKNIATEYEKAEKKLSGKGRILLRESGTEPVIRVMVECSDEALCRECAMKVAKAIEKSEYFLPGS